ncbi:methyl-accepting chemotaxis protein [Paenibacillus sp. FJAT-26967]|uniref:methyl-accepting chemotaxis protein n=1 Tax=Paenibacillus sp. FJAT-26967 TaxID=1729690 RepID=UPI000A7D90F2|nr:methyl-accepting chemotaxis protein [Paenibacillus sp. FJAT-26967]
MKGLMIFDSLKKKLIVLMCLILVTSLGTVYAASYLTASAMLTNSLDQESALQSKQLAMKLDKFFESKIAIAETVTKLLSKDSNYNQDLKMIQQAQEQYPEFETFFFSHDLSGKKVISFQGESKDLSDRPHYQEAGKGTGKIVVSEPNVSIRTGNNVVTLIVPIMKGSTQTGYAGATIQINEIQRYVSEEKFGESGYAYLVTKSGMFLWHPDNEMILKSNLKDVNVPELQQAFSKITAGESGTAEYKSDGEMKYVSYAPTGLNWGIFITAPTAELYAPVDRLSLILVLISVVTLLIAGGLIYLFATRLIQPIIRLNKAVKLVAAGNLSNSVEVAGNDEIATLSQDFNLTVGHLKHLIEGVSKSSNEVLQLGSELGQRIDSAADSSRLTNKAIAGIAVGAQSQAYASEEMAISMNEMSRGIVRIAETSAMVAESATEAAREAEEGAEVVEHTVRQMGEISSGTSNALHAAEQWHERSGEISGIVDTITELAGQINLLSLNASIEAARAGEHGRGFAVVAGEVKKLAEASKYSAGKISDLLSDIRSQTDRVVEAMSDGNRNVQEGLKLIEEVRDKFSHILRSSRHVAANIQEVSAASEEMSAGAEEVSASLEEMQGIAKHTSQDSDKVAAATQEQLGAMEEMKESMHSLDSTMKQLQEELSKFKV